MRRRIRWALGAGVLTLLLAACSQVSDAATLGFGNDGATTEQLNAGVELFDSSAVHEIGIVYDQDDYEEMITTFSDTGEKDWIEAEVTIDGVTYSQAGIRLKGNSSLMSLMGDFPRPGPGGRDDGPGSDASADEPEQLPWLIRLDKYVDGQNHDGIFDLVVRSNMTETSLNEAVSLELLGMAGLASQDAIAVRFSVNGSSEVLRLVIEHPDDVWMADELSAGGALYKAESTGDYSYRGDDPDAYDEVFDQEAGEDNADLTPLIEFLAFINDSDDATFAEELGEHLDIDQFATYLAMQELIDNFDDIDGPGNNSYLYYDPDLDRFTVVPWDHNLAFAAFESGGTIEIGPDGTIDDLPEGWIEIGPDGTIDDLPEGWIEIGPDGTIDDLPEGWIDGDAGGFIVGGPWDGDSGRGLPPGLPDGALPGPGGPLGGNVLAERFLAVDEFADLYEQQLSELRSTLYYSGVAEDVLDSWVALLTTEAADLVDPDTVADEAAAIAGIMDGSVSLGRR